jgi:hypothetical protein
LAEVNWERKNMKKQIKCERTRITNEGKREQRSEREVGI